MLGYELKLFVVVDIAYRWVPFYCKISFVVGHTFERERESEREIPIRVRVHLNASTPCASVRIEDIRCC